MLPAVLVVSPLPSLHDRNDMFLALARPIPWASTVALCPIIDGFPTLFLLVSVHTEVLPFVLLRSSGIVDKVRRCLSVCQHRTVEKMNEDPLRRPNGLLL